MNKPDRFVHQESKEASAGHLVEPSTQGEQASPESMDPPVLTSPPGQAPNSGLGGSAGGMGATEAFISGMPAELALQVSEAQLMALFEAMPIGVSVLDVNNRIAFANPALGEILGLSHEQLLTGDYRRRTYLRDDDTPMPDREFPSSRAVSEGQAVNNVEIQVVKEDGSRMWVSVSAKPLHVGEWRVISTTMDITDRKRAERKLAESKRLMAETASMGHVGAWEFSVDTLQLTWTEEVYRIHEVEQDFVPTVEKGIQFYTEGSRLQIEQAVSRAIELGEPFDDELEICTAKGNRRYVHAIGKADPARRVVHGFFQDITEHKLAAEERHRLQTQLQQSQKMESLGTLAGGVAHDMNNVLGAILGLASAHIGRQSSGSPLHQALDTICKAAERGGKMVKGLLNFARQSPAENKRLDVNALLREQAALLERTTLAKVRLEIDLEAGLRPILGDASALTHAFMNLCVNAVDAMPENGTLTLRTRNMDRDWIEVVIEDNGSGMPKEVLDRAMEPFFTTKGVGKGTGLGLAMVFGTVKAHQGRMAIESEPGHGTRVLLGFPTCEQEAPIQAEGTAPVGVAQNPHGTKKVLLIDDDELMQSSVQVMLEVLGYTAVNGAQSGEEALTLLEDGLEPDLVILDMNMPGLGGTGTLPRLRALLPEVPVLLATGLVDQAALSLASGHRGVALLIKPFGLRELQKHLQNIGVG